MEGLIEKLEIGKYPVYKDSGVEWLGEIPSNWDILPGLRFIFENKDRNKGMVRKTILSLSYGNIRVKGEDELTGLVPESFETYQFVNKGDLIFRPTDLQNDTVSLRSSISEYDGIITNAYLNLRFRSNANPKFFHYFFRAIDNNKIIYGLGSGLRQNISFLDFRRFQFPFPPLQEQIAIANFLDLKTTLIDQAIAIKQKQIELLKERRQILIHKAVTRGLNPNVKLKDSGVEWIGEIPEGWHMNKNGNLARIIRGASPRPAGHPMYFNGSDIPWIAVGDITRDENIYLKTAVNFLTKAGKKQSRFIEKGIFVLTNSGATLGVPKIMDFSGCINDGVLAFIDLKENIINKLFLYYYFSSQTMRLRDEMNQGATQPNLNTNIVKQLAIAVPSIKEQKEIIEYIDDLVLKIARAISLKEQEIEKLKEYKATLINSAVTGKIKVSGV